MPRPKSGKPPLVAIAVKLEPGELEQVRRFTDLHRMSISDLIREGLRLRMEHSGSLLLTPSEHGHNGSTDGPSYTSNTTTQSESDTAVALEELREMAQAQARRIERLIAMLEQRERSPVAPVPSNNTVIPFNALKEREPVRPAGVPDKRPNYGQVTAAVLEAIKDKTRFTSAEIAQELGWKPTTVWQVLQGLVKKGVLKQRGRYGDAVYLKVEREGT